MMQQLGDIDQLENLMRGSTSPGALAEADLDRVRDLLGDDAARSLERLAELARMLEEAGLIENREGRLELTPKGIRRVGQNALSDLFTKLAKDKMGQHQITPDRHRPRAQLREQGLRVRRPVQPRPAPHHPQRHPAAGERHAGAPLAGRLRDRADRERHPLVDRADARPLAVDADAGQLPVGQEGGHGAALADQQPVPPRLPRHRRLQRGGAGAQARAAARGQLGLRLRHQHAARLRAQPPAAGQAVRHQADHHDHRRRAHRPHRPRR